MKRTIIAFLSTLVVLSSMFCTVSAMNDTVIRSSFYLSSYSASIIAGNKPGEVKIKFNVNSSKRADSIGVSKIIIIDSHGEEVATIIGTTTNGLLKTSANSNMGFYSYTGISGNNYSAEVTFYATSGGSSDSHTVNTKTATAP